MAEGLESKLNFLPKILLFLNLKIQKKYLNFSKFNTYKSSSINSSSTLNRPIFQRLYNNMLNILIFKPSLYYFESLAYSFTRVDSVVHFSTSFSTLQLWLNSEFFWERRKIPILKSRELTMVAHHIRMGFSDSVY